MAENSGDLSLGYMMGQDSGGGSGGGWGNFGEGLWAVIILAILFGRGGFGGFGGGGGGSDSGGMVTSAGLCSQFNFNNLENAVRGIQQGICDSTFALNNSIMNGFHGVDNAICTLGYQTQQGFNTLGYSMKDCCCETQRLIERGFCDMGQAINMQTRDIIENQNANYRGLMDFMVQSKIDKLQSENESLRLRASQADQNAVIRAAIDASTAEIIRRTGNDCPTPAYWVNPPTPVQVPYQNGCGCGCG